MESAQKLEKEAIRAASLQQWEKAVKLNLLLLKEDPQNIPTLNRLAWAYTESGKKKLAKTTYQKVLKLDQFNLIAQKNLDRHAGSVKAKNSQTPPPKTSGLFLEEAGKTKIASLVRLATPKVLASLRCADEVNLVPKKKLISIEDLQKRYLGSLPDDLSFRLLKFIKGGNQYSAWVKAVDKKSLQIFIRETETSPQLKNQRSFPIGSTDYIPYLSPEKIHQEKPKMTPTGEGEEASR